MLLKDKQSFVTLLKWLQLCCPLFMMAMKENDKMLLTLPFPLEYIKDYNIIVPEIFAPFLRQASLSKSAHGSWSHWINCKCLLNNSIPTLLIKVIIIFKAYNKNLNDINAQKEEIIKRLNLLHERLLIVSAWCPSAMNTQDLAQPIHCNYFLKN